MLRIAVAARFETVVQRLGKGIEFYDIRPIDQSDPFAFRTMKDV
jgi:hypothetical protein